MTSITPPSPQRPATAIRQRPDPTAAAGRGFAALLDARAASGPALAFNRNPGDAAGALAFAAMPVVAPTAIALAADETPDTSTGPASLQDRPESNAAARVVPAPSAPADAPLTMSSSYETPAATDTGMRRSAPTEVAPARGQAVAIVTALPGPLNTGSAPLSTDSGKAPMRTASTQRPERVPGTGIAVQILADENGTRVLVRGPRLDSDERSETAARIVRLLRGHGHIVSEQSIEFEGGRQ